MVTTVTGRLANTTTIQYLWDAIIYIRQQKQISNLTRIAGFMKRVHNSNEDDVKKELDFAVADNLILLEKRIGCKGTKAGVEQEGYKIPDGDVERGSHDWYCFECHIGGEMYRCSTCHRMFHHKCVKDIDDAFNDSGGFICSVCKMLTGPNKFSHFTKEYLNQLLSYTCIRLKEKTKLLHKIPHPEVDQWRFKQLVYEVLDLNDMEEKTKTNTYSRLEEYIADAQDILHGIFVFYGSAVVMSGLAVQMLGDCNYDLAQIRQCNNCYRMSNDKKDKYWFCQPCNPSHELIFAKQKGFPYWPAKVIKVEGGRYDVRFFGSFHQRAYIEKKQVRPITTPLEDMGLKKTPALSRALDELSHHQELLNNQKILPTTSQVTTVPESPKPVTPKKTKSAAPQNNKSVVSQSNKTAVPQNTKSVVSQSNKTAVPQNTKSVVSPNTKPVMPQNAKPLRKRKRKLTKELDSEEEESPSSSTKVSRQKLQSVVIPEENNMVVSSSSTYQDSPPSTSKITNSTQTCGTDTDQEQCNCGTKYTKLLQDMKEQLANKHNEEKACSLKELSETLNQEFESNKQKAIAESQEKIRQELEAKHRKAIEQIHLGHQQELDKIAEHQRIEISETKKKQWCYNCEAEAIYHCCWNTSYCSVECQQTHWHKEHKRTCRRKR